MNALKYWTWSRRLSELWRATPFVLIGANALALQIDLDWRQTNDLDRVISVALEDYPAALEALPGWQRRREGEHAWLAPTGVKVDVIPAGPGLLAAGSLTWPESGYRMNLVGLRLAFDHHVRVAIDERHGVEVATIPTIIVLKMVAFLDRPERQDDLTDIAQVVERYLAPIDDRRWALPVDFDNPGAFALGQDIGALVDEQERRVVAEFLARAKDENDRHHTPRASDQERTVGLAGTPRAAVRPAGGPRARNAQLGGQPVTGVVVVRGPARSARAPLRRPLPLPALRTAVLRFAS